MRNREEVIKYYLDKIAYYEYYAYTLNKNKNQIIHEVIVDDSCGFYYIANNDNNYSVYISLDIEKESRFLVKIFGDIKTTIKSSFKTVNIYINSMNKLFIDYLLENDYDLIYSSHSMLLNREFRIITHSDIELKPFTLNQQEQYIDLLGDAFEPIRTKLNLKPFDWYRNNKEKAIENFVESAKNNRLFGYFNEDELIGVIEVDENEIETLAVKPTYQGKGLGTLLLNKAIDLIFSNSNIDIIFLAVLDKNNKAINSYKKANFQFSGHQTILKLKSS